MITEKTYNLDCPRCGNKMEVYAIIPDGFQGREEIVCPQCKQQIADMPAVLTGDPRNIDLLKARAAYRCSIDRFEGSWVDYTAAMEAAPEQAAELAVEREKVTRYDEPARYQAGDEGPTGGIIVMVMDYPKYGWRYVEATPACIARVPWDEAKRLCTESWHWDRSDWDLATKNELASLLRLIDKGRDRRGNCTDYSAPGWHWTNERGLALSFWGPTGPWGSTRGNFQTLDTTTPCCVRPVRRFN